MSRGKESRRKHKANRAEVKKSADYAAKKNSAVMAFMRMLPRCDRYSSLRQTATSQASAVMGATPVVGGK